MTTSKPASMTLRLGVLQQAALVIYVLDPFAPVGRFPGTLDGNTLSVRRPWKARRKLVEAAKSAEVDGDRALAGALRRLADRIAGSKRFQSGSKARVLRQLATVDGEDRFLVEAEGRRVIWNRAALATAESKET